MRILFTADLHLNHAAKHPRTRRTAFETFSETVCTEGTDAVVVAGDIGAIGRARDHLVAIRKAVGDRLLAVALGNHDFWMDGYGHAKFARLHQMVTRFWLPAARDVGAVLLDRENAELGNLAIVGGYGHYNLGLAESGLQIDGERVTEDVYLSGGMNGLFWNDFRYIPNCAALLQEEARDQAEGIASRMDAAINNGKRVLLALHTCPWRELNGHPLTGNAEDILSAYSGNSMIGNEVEIRAASIDFLMCGHTHMPVSERDICGIPCLNVGADYGIFRGVIYDTLAKSIRWVGEPVSAEREACPASHNSKKLGEKAERTPQSPWWERLSTVQEPYPHIPEKQILAAMPETLHSRWEQFMGGQGVLALDDGDAGIYPSDFDRFLRSLGDSSTPREPEG